MINTGDIGNASGVKEEEGALETAYICFKDCREFVTGKPDVTNTKKALAGSTASKNKSSGQNRTIKVQFNPTSLSFSFSGKEVAKKKKTDISNKGTGESEQADAEEISDILSVSFKLVFDRSIYTEPSVQPEVESFLALVKNPYVRQHTFYWGQLCYKGIIKHVSAEYVLFNQEGIPMRATVNVTLDIT